MKFLTHKKNIIGATLIEILVVIVLIGIIAAAVTAAVRPGQNTADARDAVRRNDVTNISSAIAQWALEPGNNTVNIDQADGGNMTLCSVGEDSIAAAGSTATGNLIDLESILVNEYISRIPGDPQNETATDSGYSICDAGSTRVRVQVTLEDTTTFTSEF